MIYKIHSRVLNEFYGEEDLRKARMEEAIDHYRYLDNKHNSTLVIGTLYIPRAYAREETKIRPKDPKEVDHYEIVLLRQLGSPANRRSTYVLAQLPKSKEYVAVELFRREGGADFIKRDHSKILRGTYDELDRRIILGFCIKYAGSLLDNCYCNSNTINPWLKLYAKSYRVSEQPKRLKRGDTGPHVFYGSKTLSYDDERELTELERLGECGIFSNVEFMS